MEKTELIPMKLTARNRWVLFGGWIILSSLLFLHPLTVLARVDLLNDDLSYLIFVPLISAAILFIEQGRLIPPFSRDGVLGGGLFLTAAGVALASRFGGIAPATDLQLSGYMLALVLFWAAGFALLFGRTAVKACQFPLLFLLLLVPPPNSLLNRIIYLLQAGSAWITGTLFDLLRVPALREGFVFRLARVNIEVAKECSGIRSSMALLILALLIAHFGLQKLWKKAVFLACGLFMMVLKNGIRIVTLSLLAVYVDPSFLNGTLHHAGGIVFFLLGLLLLVPVLLGLQRGESRMSTEEWDTPREQGS